MTGSRAPIVTGQVAAGCRCRKSLPCGVNIHLDTRAMDSSFAAREAETHIVVAVSRAESQDSSGEKCRTQAGAHLNLGRASEPYHLPLIAFVQELQHGSSQLFPFSGARSAARAIPVLKNGEWNSTGMSLRPHTRTSD